MKKVPVQKLFPCLKVAFSHKSWRFSNQSQKYSRVSNNRRVWNNRIGWMFPIKLINVGYGIVVLGGNFQEIQ